MVLCEEKNSLVLKFHEVIFWITKINKYTTFAGRSNKCWHWIHLNWIILLAFPAFPQFQHLVKLASVVWKYLPLCFLLHSIAFILDIAGKVNFWPNVISILRLCIMFSFPLDIFYLQFLIKSEYHNNINTLFIQQHSNRPTYAYQ